MDGSDIEPWNVRLRQERVRRNWRQRDVAEQLGTTVLTVSRWEQGNQQPGAYLRIKLCELFGKSVEEFGFFPVAQPPSIGVEPEAHLAVETSSLSLSSLPDEAEIQLSGKDSADPVITTPSSQVPTQQFISAIDVEQQNRARLLRRLRRAYRDLLEQSLQGTALLELTFASQPYTVRNATHLLLPMTNRTPQPLPPGTSLLSIYQEAEEELLILGEPGAGKSTLLLELAQQLIKRAEEDEVQPLPLIVPLSSWAEKRLLLDAWLSVQISQLYDIPQKLSTRWLVEQRFVPLLDGLDEMEEAARSACIAAINAYHREHLGPLVVSSRTTEYEVASAQHQLLLQSAVMVLPLSPKQIDDALTQSGSSQTVLHQMFQGNPAFQEAATTPLFVHLLLLTYQGTAEWDLPQKEALLQQQLWSDYVQHMVERKGNVKRYPLEQVYSYLGWLARQMLERNQTVFYLEHLQPGWLTENDQCAYTCLAVYLPAIVIGMLISILIMSLPSLSGIVQEIVLGCFLGGLWCESIYSGNISISQTNATLRKWKTRLTTSVFSGFCFALSFGFNLNPAHYAFSNLLHSGLFFGTLIGLGNLLLQILFARQPWHPILASYELPLPLWKRLARFLQTTLVTHALFVAILYGLIYGLIYGLGYGQDLVLGYRPDHSLIYGLDYGLNYALNYGLISVAIGLIIALLASGVRLPERLKWTWGSLKKSFFSLKHLRITFFLGVCFLLLGLTTGFLYGSFYGLIYGLISGLGIGFGYWLLFGLFQGIAQEQIEDRDRRVPNQGIRRALYNSLIVGIISAGILGLLGFLGYGLAVGLNTTHGADLSHILHIALSTGPGMGILIGLSGGCLVWLLVGGVAALRHTTIRYLLWRSQTFPWQAISFLDDATARVLLRRIGGGYSFVHRQFLDHLTEARIDKKV